MNVVKRWLNAGAGAMKFGQKLWHMLPSLLAAGR